MGKQETIEELRRAAHEAPMNKVFTDHKGRRHLGTHSMAWASAAREYAKAVSALNEDSGE